MSVSGIGSADTSAYSRPMHTREEITANTAQKAATEQARQASALKRLVGAASVSISPEAWERLKNDAQAANEAARNGTLGEQYTKLTADSTRESAGTAPLEPATARSPGAHALYTDRAANVHLTDFQSFFRHAKEDLSMSPTALADALYEAVSRPSGSTDTAQALEIGLLREKLNVLNTRYVDEAHQAEVAMEIDHFVHRLMDERNTSMRQSVEFSVDHARKYGNDRDVAQAHADVESFDRGEHRTQREMQQVLDITTTAANPADLSRRLTAWADGLRLLDDVSSSLIDERLAEWTAFVAHHGG